MKIKWLLLMMVSFGVQANWAGQVNPQEPVQPRGDGGVLPVVVGSVADPVGDAFGMEPMSPNLDVSQLSAYLDGGNVLITMNFATPIAPADAGAPESLFGFIEIDADQDPLSGNTPGFDIFCPQPTQLGVEFFIDLGSVSGGEVEVSNNMRGLTNTAPISFTANSFTIDLPLALIGDPANVHMASVIGSLIEPTDCVPDDAILAAGVPSIPVPTLTPWMLLILLMLMVVLTTRAVRRQS